MLWWLQDRIFPLKVCSEFQMCNTPVAQDSRQISGKLQITPYYLDLVTSVQNRLYTGSRGRMFLSWRNYLNLLIQFYRITS